MIIIPSDISNQPLPMYNTLRGLGIMEGHADMFPTFVEVDKVLAGNSDAIHAQFVYVTGISPDHAGSALAERLAKSRQGSYVRR